MKAPVFSAIIQCKEDTKWQLERVAELAAEQSGEQICWTCSGTGIDHREADVCLSCDGSGIQPQQRDPADYDSHDYD